MTGAHRRWLRGAGFVAGALLLLIGLRFFIVPGDAQRTFGLPQSPGVALGGFAFHYVIGLRDIWLALLAMAFAWLAMWRALALWLLLAVAVCVGDGLLVLMAGGHLLAVAFHWGSAVFCQLVGLACWRAGGEMGPEGPR